MNTLVVTRATKASAITLRSNSPINPFSPVSRTIQGAARDFALATALVFGREWHQSLSFPFTPPDARAFLRRAQPRHRYRRRGDGES